MIVLGIETSCDETAVAVVKKDSTDSKVLLKANLVSSSLLLHQRTGGIIPEIAAREQMKYLLPLIEQALGQALEFKIAKNKIPPLDTIAVTYGPGLIGSLLVGVETAKTLSFVWQKPLIPINHMVGHIYANFISENSTPDTRDSKLNTIPHTLTPKITFPALALVVSGGHTDLLLMKRHGNFKLLGGTRDDAAGECFDKCARLLGYSYPGGPQIAKLAEKGNPQAFAFTRPMIGSGDYEFSFSGLKTAFLYMTQKHFPVIRNASASEKIGWQQVVLEEKLAAKDKQLLFDLCASLQEAIVSVLVKKTLKAAKQYEVKSLLISGGVAANQLLRDRLNLELSKQLPETRFSAPAKALCTDNAAMIASAACFNYKPVDWHKIIANPELYFAKN